MPVSIASFYKFCPLENLPQLRAQVWQQAQANNLLGTILLASEGINATVCGEGAKLNGFIGQLEEQLGKLAGKYSQSTSAPFARLSVKVKEQILSFRHADAEPLQVTGERVAPQHWNELLDQPELLLLDVRNDYEVRVGSFVGAVNPGLQRFDDFAAYSQHQLSGDKTTPVAMYCTGGIRCEKSSAYLLNNGFDKVYQLDGGILAYLQQVPENNSRWRGECFVFDHRVSLDHQLQPGSFSQCYACRSPLSPEDRQSSLFEPGISCPHCQADKSPEDRARYAMRQQQLAKS